MLKTEMVYFYISIMLIVVSLMIGWGSLTALLPCPLSLLSLRLLFDLSPTCACLAECTSSYIDLPVISLSPFQSTIHATGGLGTLSVSQYCYFLDLTLHFFCLGSPGFFTQHLHIYLHPKIYFSVHIFSVEPFLFPKAKKKKKSDFDSGVP